MDKVDWRCLSSNPNAIDILKNNMDKVDWRRLCRNDKVLEILYCIDKDNQNAILKVKNILKNLKD
jgi:hypothetical protein